MVAEQHGLDQLLHADLTGHLATAKQTFQKYDENCNGGIDAQELLKLCEDFGYKINQRQATQKVAQLCGARASVLEVNFHQFAHWWNDAGKFEFLAQLEEEDWVEEVIHEAEVLSRPVTRAGDGEDKDEEEGEDEDVDAGGDSGGGGGGGGADDDDDPVGTGTGAPLPSPSSPAAVVEDGGVAVAGLAQKEITDL
jgi:hypothetical protein